MRMTEEKFNLLLALKVTGLTHAEKAKIVGCKKSSIALYTRFNSWAEYEEHKKIVAKRTADSKAQNTREIDVDPREVEEVTIEKTSGTATLSDVIEKMQQIHEDAVDIHLAIMALVNWEERKQELKQAYIAKKEERRRNYFARWGNEK